MSEPFIGEIRIVGFNFAPRGWATCDGQLLPIAQNTALFSLLGTTYGGNGQTTFALPDLRGRAPMHPGSGFAQGQRQGAESHTLTAAELPSHTHALMAGSDAWETSPGGNVLGGLGDANYAPPGGALLTDPQGTSHAGGGQSHNNMQPFLVVNFVIALQGIFPSRN